MGIEIELKIKVLGFFRVLPLKRYVPTALAVAVRCQGDFFAFRTAKAVHSTTLAVHSTALAVAVILPGALSRKWSLRLRPPLDWLKF